MKFEVKEIKELNSSVGLDELSQKFVDEGWELSEDGSFVKENKVITLIDETAFEVVFEGQFKGAELKKIVGDAITHLIKGINGLEEAMNYLKTNGQGGAVGSFKKSNKFDELKKLVDFIDSKNESCVDEEDDEDKIDEAKTVKVNFDDDSEVTFSDGTTAVIDYDGGFKYQGKYFEPDWGDGSDIEGTMKKLQDEMNKTFKGKVKFVFENAITRDGEVYESFDKIYDKYAKKDYWDLASFIENKKAELKRFQEKGDKNALKYTEADIEKSILDQNKTAMKNMYDQLKDAHDRKDLPFLQERLRHDQKITLEFFADITGVKLPKTTKAIHQVLNKMYKVEESADVNENFNKLLKKYPKAARLLSTWAGFSSTEEMTSNDDYTTVLPKLDKAITDAVKSGKNDVIYKCISDKFLNGKWFDEDKQIIDREMEMIKKYGF